MRRHQILTAIVLLARTLSAAPVRADVSPAAGGEPTTGAEEQAAVPPALTVADEAVANMDREARKRFELGRAAYDAGRFREAGTEFNEAYRLSRRPELLYNVYVAQREAGQWPEAIEALRGYLDNVADAPDSVNLRARLDAMEAQLRVREEDARARRLAEEAARKSQTRKETVPSMVPWAIVGGGGAVLLAGAVTGGLALGKKSALDGACDGSSCPASSRDDIDSLKTLALSSDVLLGVGAASMVTGLVLYFAGALDKEREVPVVSAYATDSRFVTTLTSRF